MAKIRDYKPDTWVGEDNLGRQMLQAKDLKAANPDAKVGIFYLYWHDQRQKGLTIYDHTKLYNEGGVDAVWDAIPKGPMGQAHYWAEPYFGYYMSDDEWIIRKHAKMLVEAGVDFIFIDNTNGLSYPYNYLRIYQIYMQMRKEGQMTPQIVHFIGVLPDLVTNFMKEVYDNIYATDYYKDLWFMWEGKPLILGTMEKVPEYRKYFTNRECWAYDDWIGDGMGKWPWITSYPQTPGRNPETGEIEQVVASCGFHANGSTGRSFHDGQQPTDGKNDFEFELSTTPYGLGFAEQMKQVLKIAPPVVMLCGWNEWWAGRWGTIDGVNPSAECGQKICNTYYTTAGDPVLDNYYVDAFNGEFSRDFEPMKGGFEDNYYYQMVNAIRQIKGARAQEAATGQKTIDISGCFCQWDDVGPEYLDAPNDTTHRAFISYGCQYTYANYSGRNDFDTMKVSQDEDNLYFYIKTFDDITAPEGTNWMNLFLNLTCDYKTGWKGFDFIINRFQDGSKVSIEKNIDGAWNWEKVGEGEYRMEGNQMMLKVPKSALGAGDLAEFWFKFADNSVKDGDAMQFWDQGDAAPAGKLCYQYLKK